MRGSTVTKKYTTKNIMYTRSGNSSYPLYLQKKVKFQSKFVDIDVSKFQSKADALKPDTLKYMLILMSPDTLKPTYNSQTNVLNRT